MQYINPKAKEVLRYCFDIGTDDALSLGDIGAGFNIAQASGR
jgi:hypothetical protein